MNFIMKYAGIFSAIKSKIIYVLLIFAQNIECGYTKEPLRRCGFKEYP